MMNAPIALKNSRDPHYLIPGMNASDVNFSSAGTLISTRVQTMSRLQWQGQENEQLMNQISADGYSYGIRGGWGVQLNHQWYNNGGIQVGQVAFTYSPKISVSNWFSVEPSVRMKMGNKRLDAGLMEGTDAVEIERGNARDFYSDGTQPIGRNLWYKDLGFGMLVNTKWFFAGVQVDNVFRYKDNLYDNNWSDPRRAQNHFTATLGSDWVSRNEKMALSPYVVYQKNEQLSELWAGANYSFKWFNIGVAGSTNLDPAASIGMKFDRFSLHYNADYTQSSMLEKKAFSHQLTLRFLAKSSTVNTRVFKR
jgi:type IX secretion system PorP/SprF family membrane protein